MFHESVKQAQKTAIDIGLRPAALSHRSRAAKPDGHLVAIDDDRDITATPGMGQHALHVGPVLLYVYVFERNVPPGKVLTGGCRVGSSVFAEDEDHCESSRSLARTGLEAGAAGQGT